jgi:hypothetical protein
MSFPLSFLLYAYYAFLAVWAVFVLVALYHIARYGFKNIATFLTTAVFMAVALFLLSASFMYIGQIDWSVEIDALGLFNDPGNQIF